MKLILAILLLFWFQAAEPHQQLDLKPILENPEALQKVKILYGPPTHKGNQVLIVYGSGLVVWQAYPERLMSVTTVPTCTSKISVDRVKSLVGLMIEKHFVDLPEKHYVLVFSGYSQGNIELHTIAIDTGVGKARRTFGIGDYVGKQESIPANFASVEQELKQLKDTAFPPSAMNCHLAPAIQF
jgi:hypothetical protein